MKEKMYLIYQQLFRWLQETHNGTMLFRWWHSELSTRSADKFDSTTRPLMSKRKQSPQS